MSYERLSVGVPGIDEILHGGLLAQQAYLLRGGPGCGKTTLGWHFLAAETPDTNTRLFITLSESADHLRRVNQHLTNEKTKVEILDLSPDAAFFRDNQAYNIFSAADVESDSLIQKIVETVERLKPSRIFIDSMTQFRYLVSDTYQFRQQVVSCLRYLTQQGATVMFTSEASQEAPDEDLQFVSDGILTLAIDGTERSFAVSKLRGSNFRKGHHAMRITSQGIEVFPKLQLSTLKNNGIVEKSTVLSFGVPEIDELLKGGLEAGTITIISGPSGVGKTTLGMQFIKEAAGRGDRSTVYLFEEAPETLLNRCEGINIPVRAMEQRGTLAAVPIEPLSCSPDEFAHQVRRDIEVNGTQIVMLDSIAGYRLAFQQHELVRNLHLLCQYLKRLGVTVILINEVETIVGDFKVTELGISYLADNLIFLRFLELRGELRRAIGVLKKRLSDFEKTLREFEITRYGIKVGHPLDQLRGILGGLPELLNDDSYHRP